MWRKKRVIFAAITALAVLSVVFPYYNQTMLFLAFAPHHNQNTLVLDAGHGGIDGGAVAEMSGIGRVFRYSYRFDAYRPEFFAV